MPIPNVSSKHCPTLNHLFTVPSSHERNFVRENKQFVRDKSKQQQQQYAKNNQIPIAGYSVQKEGQSHLGYSSGRSSTRLHGGKDPGNDIPLSGNFTKLHLRQKSREVQTSHQSEDVVQQKSSKSVSMLRRQPVTRPMKQKASTRGTQNVAVQTEEISDEIYLYTALKKCASPAFKSALKAKYLQKEEDAKQKHHQEHLSDQRQYPPDEGPNLCPNQPSKETKSAPKMEHLNEYDKNTNLILGWPKNKSRPYTNSFEVGDNAYQGLTDVNDQFNVVMSLPPEMKKTCQPNACVNCPEGYHLLTEKEREHIRLKLLERETLLIKQLNSFPLAIETLRVRQSKTRIEHELSLLEQSLRKLTKKKVYVKHNE